MNIVQQIFDSITSLAQAELGAEWKPMPKIYDPAQADDRRASKAFGVKHGAAQNAEGILRNYTLDHHFDLLLQRTFVEKLDDSAIQAVINELYDKADDCLTEFMLKKLGLPAIVLIVNEPSMPEPEILGNASVVLRVGFNVKYKNAVSL